MKKKIIILLIVFSLLLGGGFIIWKLTQNKANSSSLSQEQELEKYLLEKRLDLQKYFVFNLGELKPGDCVLRDSENREKKGFRELSQQLSQHLTKLSNKTKNFIHLYSPDPKWTAEKLNQKIREGEIYISFEKIPPQNPHHNWFLDVKTLPNASHLALPASQVNIFPSQKEAREFLKKNDPALVSKF